MAVILLLTNISLCILLFGIYILLPEQLIDSFLSACWKWIQELQPDLVKKVEQNIRLTFPIHILHPIPDRSIRIWHPHGISATTIGIHNVYRISDPKYTDTRTVIHYVFAMVPFLHDIGRFMNCISSEYQEMVKALKTSSITIGLGGVDEMGRVKHKQLELVIKKRKGIFKIALETGTPIVPVLTYGENEIFPETDNEILIWVNQRFYEVFRMRLSLPSLQSIRNWANLLVRPLEPVHTYTGRPIYVKKIDKPTDRHIRILRNIYIKRIRELFAETNPGEFSLKIV